jgi:hypothetical protein
MLLIQENLFSLTLPLSEEAFLPILKPAPFFITCVLSLTLMIATLLMTLQPQRFTLIFKFVFAKQRFSQLFRDNDAINKRLYVFLIIIACTIEALAFYLIINYFHIPAFEDSTPEMKFCIGLVFLMLYYIAYFLTITFVNWLFDYQELTKTHISNNILHHFAASACLYPFLALTCYNAKINLSVLLLAIWIVSYILLTYKQLRLYIKNIGLFHFFLYFCTTEILPVLIIGKLYLVLGK